MRLNKSATLLAGLFVAASLTTGPASAAALDVPGLELGAFGYNAYGADRAENRNSEYIDIRNTSAEAVVVKGLVVEDAWRHGQPDSYTGQCNRYTVQAVPQSDGRADDVLPAGHTLRVYVGAGTPRVLGTRHDVFWDSPVRCGYNGHVFNNGPGSSVRAPWDTVWVKLGANVESKSYNYSFGYWLP